MPEQIKHELTDSSYSPAGTDSTTFFVPLYLCDRPN